jgi:hypothetical protein
VFFATRSHSRHQTFGPPTANDRTEGLFPPCPDFWLWSALKFAAKFLASHVIQCPIISHRPSLSYDAEAGVLDFVQSIRPGGGRLAGLGRHQSANQNLYHLAEPSQDWKRSKDLQENG